MEQCQTSANTICAGTQHMNRKATQVLKVASSNKLIIPSEIMITRTSATSPSSGCFMTFPL